MALGVALLIVWLLSQMTLLSWADLSYVLPVTSVGYVLVALVGRFFLHEADHAGRWAGIGLIMAGVVLVSRTEPRTRSTAQARERPMKWALVAVIVAATTVGDVLKAMGMQAARRNSRFRPGRPRPRAGGAGAQ